jgi:hypothetical protein
MTRVGGGWRRSRGPGAALPRRASGQRVGRGGVPEELACIPPADLALLVDGDLGQVALEEGLGVRPRRVGVGIIRLDQDVVDPDDVAGGEARGVVEGAEPEVAAEDLGGGFWFDAELVLADVGRAGR